MDVLVNYKDDNSPKIIKVQIDIVSEGVWYVDVQADINDLLITYSSGIAHGDPRLVVMLFHDGCGTEVVIASNDDKFASGVRSVLDENWGSRFFVISRELAASRRQLTKLVFVGGSNDS